MKQSISPETNAIVACARAFLSPVEVTSLRTALSQPLDWEALQRMADDHCVMPLVAYVLNQQASELVPTDVLQQFREQFVRVTQNNLAGVQEWQRVLQQIAHLQHIFCVDHQVQVMKLPQGEIPIGSQCERWSLEGSYRDTDFSNGRRSSHS